MNEVRGMVGVIKTLISQHQPEIIVLYPLKDFMAEGSKFHKDGEERYEAERVPLKQNSSQPLKYFVEKGEMFLLVEVGDVKRYTRPEFINIINNNGEVN